MTGPTELVLLGSGGLARETVQLAAQIPGYQVRGFLDDDEQKLGCVIDGTPVVGRIDDLPDLLGAAPGLRAVLCTGSPGDPGSRRRIAGRIAVTRERWTSLVHPQASIAGTCTIGVGSIISAGVVATAAVHVGDHVAVMPGVVLTHDDVIADFVTIAAGVRLAGGVTVGEGAYLGSGCLVREGVQIGAGALIGMGSTVLEDVPPGEVWAGTPARRLRPRAQIPVPVDGLARRDQGR